MTETNEEQEILISMDANGAHIVSEKVMEKIKKKKLSASMITGLQGCHARWLADTFVTRDILPEEPDNAARRGSMFHSVMEEFFALPPEERTHDAMRIAVKTVLAMDDYKDLAEIPEAVKWLRGAVNGYYNMGGKPQQVEIATIHEDDEEKSGIELFVQGQIGETKRPILGFIDQVIVDPSDPEAVVIQDWKSGAKVKRWKAHTKSLDGLPEQRQQIIYSELMRQKGHKVSGARLIYPVARETVDVDLSDADLRDRVISDVEEADRTLDILIETNEFEFKPDFLCAWCPLVHACAKAQVKPYAKMQEAAAKQPSIDELAVGIEFI